MTKIWPLLKNFFDSFIGELDYCVKCADNGVNIAVGHFWFEEFVVQVIKFLIFPTEVERKFGQLLDGFFSLGHFVIFSVGRIEKGRVYIRRGLGANA